ITTDASSNVIVSGAFTGTVDFGAGPLTSKGASFFIAKLTDAGVVMWSKTFALTWEYAVEGVTMATDASGNILLAGTLHDGSMDFGGGPLMPGVVVAKLDPSGNHLWSRSLSDNTDDRLFISAYDAKDVLVGGTFAGTLQLSTKSLSSVGE